MASFSMSRNSLVSQTNLDDLVRIARNRGLKLVRSRVRIPTKPGFGKVGLTDSNGVAVFAIGTHGPTGSLEDVEDHLRKIVAEDWGGSLEGARLAAKHGERTRAKDGSARSPKALLVRSSRLVSNSRPQLRNAKASDAERLSELIRYLGHKISPKDVRHNLDLLKKSGETPLVATLDDLVVGLCGIAIRVVIARPAPLGRITSLVVAKEAQNKGVARMLVEASEDRMRKAGCILVEVTSNDRLSGAHAFYRHLGFERTSIRFAKDLK